MRGEIVDWPAMRAAFVACELSTLRFANEHGLDQEAVKSRARREKWLDERKRRAGKSEIDWPAMEAAFIAGGETIGEFARTRGLDINPVRHRASEDEWVRKRALQRAGPGGINWVQLRTEYAVCNLSLRAFTTKCSLKYSTVYRHYRQERWELARINHRLDVARRTQMKVGTLQARTEGELDFIADDECAGFVDAIDKLKPDIERMQDVKTGMQAFMLAHRMLRITHGLTPEKERPVGKQSTIGIRSIFIADREGKREQVFPRVPANDSNDGVGGRDSREPHAQPEAARVPAGQNAVSASGGGRGERQDDDRTARLPDRDA
jgi:hypothetical protein